MEPTAQDMECLVLGLSDTDQITRVSHALSVKSRVEILNLLGEKNIMSVNEIAQALHLPISSASMHVSILQEAGLVVCERMPSIHGSLKTCARRKSSIYFKLKGEPPAAEKQLVQSLPLGAYSAVGDIVPACGLASQIGPIGIYNNPRSFFLPERLDAQILWLKSGYLDYQFSPLLRSDVKIKALELSFEVCTQALIEEQAQTTSIQVLVNDHLLGERVCSCDSEGRRGTFNPAWWPDVSTQHGELQKWRVTEDGTYLQSQKIADLTLSDLALDRQPNIAVRLYVPAVCKRQAGINLFGTGFGDYNQAINLMIGYQ